MKKERSSNIELLRIVAMIMIIIYHIWCHCISIQLSNDTMYFIEPHFYKKLMLFAVISPFGQIANALFILISGYFMIEKKTINITKIAKKLFSQGVYATIALLFLSIVIYKIYSNATISFVTINYFNYGSWFVGYYFVIILTAYLLLNKIVGKIDEKKYIELLVILFAIIQFSYITEILRNIASNLVIYLTGVFLYLLGGYIKKYEPFKNVKTVFFIFGIIFTFVLIIISNYNINSSRIEVYNYTEPFRVFIENYPNNFIIPITLAVCFFELFRRLKIKQNKVINYISSSTLMIYLLHDNDLIYSLWNTVDWLTLLKNTPHIFMYKMFIWSVGIFELCLLLFIIYNCISGKIPIVFKKMFVKK